jgi:hypothetical protein
VWAKASAIALQKQHAIGLIASVNHNHRYLIHGNPAMNVISHMQSEFRRKWSLVGVLWLAVRIFFLIQAHGTHIPIHHDPLFSLLINRRAYKNVLQSHKVETTLQWALH